MPLFVGQSDGGIPRLEPFSPIRETTQEKTTLDPAILPPVTFVPARAEGWLGSIGETLRNGFRRNASPVAACLLASTMLLSGCALSGSRIDVAHASTIGVVQQQRQPVDLDRAKQLIEARSDPSRLASLLQGLPNASSVQRTLERMDRPGQALQILREKMADPKARADLASLDDIVQVLLILDMETDTKNFATPVMGVFLQGGVATQTEFGGRWDEDKNRAWTVKQLGPNGSIDLLLLCPVSGHAKDRYPDELYQQYTSYRTAPDNDGARMRANAQIYSRNNSQYVYLTDDPSSYGMGRIVVADVKADGRHVTPVRVHLEGLEPGNTYEVRWSPFVGNDPNNPIVSPIGFRNGRTFRLIIPASIPTAQ